MPNTCDNTTTLLAYLTVEEQRIADQFPNDVAGHELTVLRDDGLYRHLRCAQPDNSWLYWFEVVTWPGSLAIRGDMGGGWIFSRTPDMFQFFRSRTGMPYRVKPGYWAEKLPDCGRSVKVHSERVTKSRLADAVVGYERDVYPELEAAHRRRIDEAVRAPVVPAPMTPVQVRRLIHEYAEDDRLRFPDGAGELLGELEEAGVVSAPFEWDLTDWDWPFLWACHAIVWAIDCYDQMRVVDGG